MTGKAMVAHSPRPRREQGAVRAATPSGAEMRGANRNSSPAVIASTTRRRPSSGPSDWTVAASAGVPTWTASMFGAIIGSADLAFAPGCSASMSSAIVGAHLAGAHATASAAALWKSTCTPLPCAPLTVISCGPTTPQIVDWTMPLALDMATENRSGTPRLSSPSGPASVSRAPSDTLPRPSATWPFKVFRCRSIVPESVSIGSV